jgi:RNA polymerase sigma-70 factor (ECF subfamily)
MGVAVAKTKVSLPADPETRLMLQVREDDTAAYRELLNRYWSRVYQQLHLMVGDREEAEDLTQEVFLRVFRHRKTYQPQAKFVTWLFHIVRNIGRNAIRDRRRRPVFPILSAAPDAETGGLEPVLSDRRAETPSQPLERRELRQVVHSALRRLGNRQREALELQQFEDCTYSEIADQLAMSPQAAKSLLYRARSQLREVLAPYMLAE